MKNFDELNERETELLLDGCLESEELDTEALFRIQTSVLASLPKKKKTRVRKRLRLAVIAAALLAVLVGVTVEAKEYSDAVDFFEAYDLPTEGLTRAEIKAVYRDITTESFTYSKTAEVLERSISEHHVEGIKLPQENPTPTDIEGMWQYINREGALILTAPEETDGVQYLRDTHRIMKYADGKEVWSVSFTQHSIEGFIPVSGGVLVWMHSHSMNASTLIKLSDDGETLWSVYVDEAFESFKNVRTVIEEDDGTYAVFGHSDSSYLCLGRYDTDGNPISFYTAERGNYFIQNAVKLSDGYLLLLESYREEPKEKLVRMDREGNITDSYVYTSEDTCYYITDMVEYNGRICLSAYAVSKADTEDCYGGRYEIAAVLEKCFYELQNPNEGADITEWVRENYTAVLLLCNPTDGTPSTFCSVEGSLGGSLAVGENGELLWDTESLTEMFYSPATSSFSVGGKGIVYRYTFDENGNLKGKEQTGEITTYRR